jgi:fatty acid kinase fatty acid binding subunit
MSDIAFVTDSTAYIPQELIRKYNVAVAPLVLVWGDKNYRDGVDIQPEEFYTQLKTAKVMPTTSQPSVEAMREIFQPLTDRGAEVLGVFISSKLSGTIQSAVQAREQMGTAGQKVTIIDSNACAMAAGFQLLAAVRAAHDGATLQDCVEIVERCRERAGVYFAVDTLEFLHRGGRIGGATRFIGSALNLKPILALRDGRVEAEDRVRTKSKALDKVLDLVASQVRGNQNIRLATVHANAEAEARELLDRASKELGAVESVLAAVSPVVGAHAGPGTVGLAYISGI